MQAQFALSGAVQSVAKVVVKLDGRTVSTLRGGRSVLTLRVRARTGNRLAIDALATDGRRLAARAHRAHAARRQARRRLRRWRRRSVWAG